MAYKIIWSPEALATFDEIVNYLDVFFSDLEVSKFISTVNRRLLLLQQFPQTFRTSAPTAKRRRTVIHKRTILYYKIRERKKEVELLSFFDTRQNPGRLKF